MFRSERGSGFEDTGGTPPPRIPRSNPPPPPPPPGGLEVGISVLTVESGCIPLTHLLIYLHSHHICMYMLWFNFILGLIFISHCFNLIIIHYHTPKQREIKFKLRIKLNHNIYNSFRIVGQTRSETLPETFSRTVQDFQVE